MVGKLLSVWRYPVKSMLGEEVAEIGISERGLDGDRVFALVDRVTGKVASAKNPRLWPNLFDHAASLEETQDSSDFATHLCITLPTGDQLRPNQPELVERLSHSIGREVEFVGLPKEIAKSEGYWPDHDWLANRNQVFDFALPAGTL